MLAIQYQAYGGYQENRPVELPVPRPTVGEVLLKMRSFGINPLDNTFRSGEFYAATPENLPRVGGQTGVGVVVESHSPEFALGERVFVSGKGFGLTADGTWREWLAIPAAGLWRVPDYLDDAHAAAFFAGAGYLTAYLSLTELAQFKPGQAVLAPGVSGAVGMEGVQIARQLGASLAISTATSTPKAEQARAAGYEHVIDLSKESLLDGVMRLTGGKGVDVVIDGVRGALTGQARGALAFGGTLVVVGCAGGRKAEIDVTDLIWRAAHVHGFTLRSFRPDTLRAAQRACVDFVAAGELKPTVARVFPLAEAADAVRYLIEGGPFGRVVMKTGE